MAAKKKIEITPKRQIEALLFSSGRTMSEEQLAALAKLDQKIVKKALAELEREYAERDSALLIFNDPTGWKMMVRDMYVPTVKNIVADTELSRACMETLAIIAYKYPKVLQSEVIDIRGSGAYEHMAELERLGFISREPLKRSYAVKLTDKFFNYFDVAGGKDIREVFKNVRVPKRVTVDAQKTLGDLQIVDAAKTPPEHHEHHKMVDGLEVVKVEPPASPAEDAQNAEHDAQAAPQPKGDHSAFLSDLDERIARMQERNDETEKDPLFQRKPLPGMEEVQQEAAPSEETAETAESSESEEPEQKEN